MSVDGDAEGYVLRGQTKCETCMLCRCRKQKQTGSSTFASRKGVEPRLMRIFELDGDDVVVRAGDGGSFETCDVDCADAGIVMDGCEDEDDVCCALTCGVIANGSRGRLVFAWTAPWHSPVTRNTALNASESGMGGIDAG